jgi:hypothetical protein
MRHPLPVSAVFSFKEHLRDDGERLPVTFISAFKTLLDVRDVAHTLADHVQVSASPGDCVKLQTIVCNMPDARDVRCTLRWWPRWTGES